MKETIVKDFIPLKHETKPDYFFNFCLVGASGVGKSCIGFQYCYQKFKPMMTNTIGCEFLSRDLELRKGGIVRLCVYDTAGQDRFVLSAVSFMRKASAVMLVYDVTNRESLDRLHGWMREIQERAGSDVSVVVCGNKSDMRELKENCSCVTAEEVEAFKQQYPNIMHFECSAKTGHNIRESMEYLIGQAIQKVQKEKLKSTNIGADSSPKLHEQTYDANEYQDVLQNIRATVFPQRNRRQKPQQSSCSGTSCNLDCWD